jgi:para-nitrobenzyl esterase
MPVMVFVHGGNTGGGSVYDPRPVSGSGNVIVVTVNYRLGALGFLRDRSLRDPDAGNFTPADQQAALRWVRTDIGDFGGDARNVTLWVSRSVASASVPSWPRRPRAASSTRRSCRARPAAIAW